MQPTYEQNAVTCELFLTPASQRYALARQMVRHYVALANEWAQSAYRVRADVADAYYELAEEYGRTARAWHREVTLMEIEHG